MLPDQSSSRKRERVVSTEVLEEIQAAERLVEITLIFDKSDGKKGAYGGLRHDARESTERTINDIFLATVPGIRIEQLRLWTAFLSSRTRHITLSFSSRKMTPCPLGEIDFTCDN